MSSSTVQTGFSSYQPEVLPVLCWIFDADEIEAEYGTCRYSAPVEHALFSGLSRIAGSKSARVRERTFPIFSGDLRIEPLYAVAVPESLPDSITSKLTRAFESVYGFREMEFGQLPDLPLTCGFTYANGIIRIHRRSGSKIGDETDIFNTHGIRAEFFS